MGDTQLNYKVKGKVKMKTLGKRREAHLQTTTDHAVNGIVATTPNADNLNFGIIYMVEGASHRPKTTSEALRSGVETEGNRGCESSRV